jgi:prefoldin subunit 5
MSDMSYLILQDLNRELHELNKTMSGIRYDLQEIHQALDSITAAITQVNRQ